MLDISGHMFYYSILYIWQTQIDVQSLIDVHSSNRRPLKSLSQITVRFKGNLKSASFSNSQIYGRCIAIKSMSFSGRRTICTFILSYDRCWSSLFNIWYNIMW